MLTRAAKIQRLTALFLVARSSSLGGIETAVDAVVTEWDRLKRLHHHARHPAPIAFLERYLERAVEVTGVSRAELLGRTRTHLKARVELWLALRDVGYTVVAIGAAFGRDHSTVVRTCRRYELRMGAEARARVAWIVSGARERRAAA